MTTLPEFSEPRTINVSFVAGMMVVKLEDGRTVSVPLAWYPRLQEATEAERENWRLIGRGIGIHWPDIDEDLSTEGLLRGTRDPHRSIHSLVALRMQRRRKKRAVPKTPRPKPSRSRG